MKDAITVAVILISSGMGLWLDLIDDYFGVEYFCKNRKGRERMREIMRTHDARLHSLMKKADYKPGEIAERLRNLRNKLGDDMLLTRGTVVQAEFGQRMGDVYDIEEKVKTLEKILCDLYNLSPKFM